MATTATQSFDTRQKAAELLRKIEQFERREQIEDLLENLDISDVKQGQKSTFLGDSRNTSMRTEVMKELLKACLGGTDKTTNRTNLMETLEELVMNDTNRMDSTRMDSTRMDSTRMDSRRGTRNDSMRQILVEILCDTLLRDQFGQDNQFGTRFGQDNQFGTQFGQDNQFGTQFGSQFGTQFGRNRNSNIRDLLEMLMDDDSTQGVGNRRHTGIRRILMEVLLKNMLRQRGGFEGRNWGNDRMDMRNEDIIREILGGRRQTQTTTRMDDILDQLVGHGGARTTQRRGGSRMLEKFLDVLEQSQSGNQDLDRMMMRMVLEYLVENRTQFGRDNEDDSDEVVSMLLRRIMMHLMNDLESARLELEVLNHLMRNRTSRRDNRDNMRRGRRGRWGLMDMIQEHLGSFDAPTRRRLEDTDVIRAILRLKYSDEGEDMDNMIIRLLRNWFADNEQLKVRGGRFRNLVECIRELTSNPYQYTSNTQDSGRRFGNNNIEEVLRSLLSERQGGQFGQFGGRGSWSRQVFDDDDDFHGRGNRGTGFSSRSSGDRNLKEQILCELFDRQREDGRFGRSDGMRRGGVSERWF